MAKKSKNEVNYRKATRMDRRCGNCRYMNDDGTCDRVAGQVSPRMLCNLYSPAKVTSGTRR